MAQFEASVLCMLRRSLPTFSSQAPPLILTAPETGSTLSWFQKHPPAGGCYGVLPFESRKKGEESNEGMGVERDEGFERV